MSTLDVNDAKNGIQPAIKALIAQGARCMEQTADKAGIIIERWMLPNGAHVIVYGTPHWRDVFVPIIRNPLWDQTVEAIKVLAAKTSEQVRASVYVEVGS